MVDPMRGTSPSGEQQPQSPGPTPPRYGPQPPAPPPPAAPSREPARAQPRSGHPALILVSHSPLVYWWPVWAVGYVMAGLTWWDGRSYAVGGESVRFHPASGLGVLFLLTLFLVIVISNVGVRGYASGVVIL